MNDEMSMDRSFVERAFWPVAIILGLLLVLLAVLGYAPFGQQCAGCLARTAVSGAVAPAPMAPLPEPPAVVAIPAPQTPAASATGQAEPAAAVLEAATPPAEPAAGQAVERSALPVPAPARIYFTRDSDELPASANDALRGIVDYLVQVPDAHAIVSGFHDPSGDPLYNEDLARRRAVAVQTALHRAGVEPGRIELVKPMVTAIGGAKWEARRVEVTVVPP
jgi:outer membrane protein OmpA-like peptidoglycan-associated protein